MPELKTIGKFAKVLNETLPTFWKMKIKKGVHTWRKKNLKK